MSSNATNKTRTGPKQVRTQEPEEEQETPTTPPSSTPSSPTKAAKDALDMAVASLPTSLQYPNPPFRQQDYNCPLKMI